MRIVINDQVDAVLFWDAISVASRAMDPGPLRDLVDEVRGRPWVPVETTSDLVDALLRVAEPLPGYSEIPFTVQDSSEFH
jgi:hypothetical protein